MELFQSRSFHLVWHKVIKMINRMPCSEGTTRHKSLMERKVSRPLKTILEIIDRSLEAGQWTPRTFFTMANHFCTRDKLNHTLLLLTQEVPSWQFHLKNIRPFKQNGKNSYQILTVPKKKRFAKPEKAAKKLAHWSNQLASKLVRPFSKWNPKLIFIKVTEYASLL